MVEDPSPRLQITPQNSEQAPFIHFDGVAAFGSSGGTVQLELAANALAPVGGSVRVDLVMVAHLRCNPVAAMRLRDAIDKALQMQSQQATQVAPKS